jgi:hypothetical protein
MRRTNALQALMCAVRDDRRRGPPEPLFSFTGRVALADRLIPDGVR